MQIINASPEIVVNSVDTSGAGDAFFSKTLQQYAYTKKIDEEFVNSTFKMANELSRKTLMHVGSRINK